MMWPSLVHFLDTQRDTVIDLQRGLVAIPALGPDNTPEGTPCTAEVAKADYVRERLRTMGAGEIIEIPAPDARVVGGLRPNLAMLLPGKDPSRTLWVISHLDIVPPGDPALWQSDPYELKVEGDTLIGRGVEDNHQGVVSSLLTAKAFLDPGLTPSINYGALFVSDEETGSLYGLDHVLKARPDLFGKNDLFVVPDFGKADSTMLEIAEKSILWLKISVKGKQCHASTPAEGINSLVAASAFILRLRELLTLHDARDPLFNPPYSTFEPTKKEANVPNVNTVPGLDVFYLDCRVLPGYDLDLVMASIAALGQEIEAEYTVSIDYQVVQRSQAAPATPADSDVVVRLTRAVAEVYKTKARPAGIGGGTVAAFLRRRGFSAAVWSTCIHNAHQPNERSLISAQLGDAKVFAHILTHAEA